MFQGEYHWTFIFITEKYLKVVQLFIHEPAFLYYSFNLQYFLEFWSKFYHFIHIFKVKNFFKGVYEQYLLFETIQRRGNLKNLPFRDSRSIIFWNFPFLQKEFIDIIVDRNIDRPQSLQINYFCIRIMLQQNLYTFIHLFSCSNMKSSSPSVHMINICQLLLKKYSDYFSRWGLNG